MKKSIALTAALFSAVCFAGNEFAAVGQTTTPPVIDGDLNDQCWKNAVEITNFVALKTAQSPAKKSDKGLFDLR